MPRPASSISSIAEAVQLAAGVRLELIHDSLGSNLGLHHGVHMVRPHVRRQQVPTSMRAMPPEGSQDGCPALLVEHKGFQEHCFAFDQHALWIGFQQSAPYLIVMPIYRARFVAV